MRGIFTVIELKVNNNNNSIQFFIIYVPSQQLQGQLQTQHSVGTIIIIIIIIIIMSKVKQCYNNNDNSIQFNSIQFNSILYFLCAESTATRQ
jgi:hypothetical protein